MGCLCDICLGDIDDDDEDSYEQGQKSLRDFPNGIKNDPFSAKDNEIENENTSNTEDYQPGIQGLTDNHNRLLDDDDEDDISNKEQNIKHGIHQQSHIISEDSSSDSNTAHERNGNKKYSKINAEDMNEENENEIGYESKTENDEIQEYKYVCFSFMQYFYHSN